MVADFRNGIFQPPLSEVIAAEIADAPDAVQILYAELMSLDAETLTVEESALELADEYQKRGIVSPNAERIAFYREQAKRMEKKLSSLLLASDIANNQKGNYSKDRNMPVKQVREKRATYKKKKP